jgi:hypothetical protein
MIGKGSLSAVTVDSRADGWVMVNFLSTRPDEGLSPPPMRLMVEAHDVKTWTAKARILLGLPADSLATLEARTMPSLGNSRYHLEMQVEQDPKKAPHIWYFGCGPGAGGTSPTKRELLDFLALLDSAAKIAGGGSGRPPTLRRVYYASEVSCPPSPLGENAAPRLPEATSAKAPRVPIAVGAQFVVDTTGDVERGSIALLPNTNPVADADGWVRVRHSGRPTVQEWFLPDSIEAWASRVDSNTVDWNTLPHSASRPRPMNLGYTRGISSPVNFIK